MCLVENVSERETRVVNYCIIQGLLCRPESMTTSIGLSLTRSVTIVATRLSGQHRAGQADGRTASQIIAFFGIQGLPSRPAARTLSAQRESVLTVRFCELQYTMLLCQNRYDS